jgi:hypothetical protein
MIIMLLHMVEAKTHLLLVAANQARMCAQAHVGCLKTLKVTSFSILLWLWRFLGKEKFFLASNILATCRP